MVYCAVVVFAECQLVLIKKKRKKNLVGLVQDWYRLGKNASESKRRLKPRGGGGLDTCLETETNVQRFITNIKHNTLEKEKCLCKNK